MPDSEPVNDAVSQPRPTWPVPTALAAAFCAYNLFFVPVHSDQPERWYMLLAIGTLFGQPVLTAAWAALGPGLLLVRLPACAAALIVFVFASNIVDWNLFAADGAKTKLNIEMAVGFIAVFIFSVVILGVVRRKMGIHITRCELPSWPARPGRNQFGMKYLLGWMTACAVLISIGRAFADDSQHFNQPWLDLAWNLACGIVFVFLLTLPPVLVPLFCLTRPSPWRCVLVAWVAWPVSLWAAVEVMRMSTRGGPPADVYWVFGGVQVGAMLAALISVAVLRIAGFRLSAVGS